MRLRSRLLMVLAATAVGSLGSSATASDPSELCNPSGRAICITTNDVDGVSHTSPSRNRHTVYGVSVRNGSGAALTNVQATLKLVDLVDGVDAPSSGAFVEQTLPAGCSLVGPTQASCALPNLPGGGGASLGSFAARTSSNVAAAVMRLDVTVTAKERGNDAGDPHDPNLDSFTKGEPTSLERLSELSASMVFAGGSTVLDTSPEDVQSTEFFLRVPNTFVGFQFATLEEIDQGEAGSFCPAGFSCFGQSMRTSAPGIFSAANPAELRSTISLSQVAKGVTPKNWVVHHDPTDGPPIAITAACSGAFGSPAAAAEIPCRRVLFDRKLGLALVQAFDTVQGDWGFS